MLRVLTVMAMVLLFSGGCGVYTFNPAGKSDYKSLAIERFENETTEHELADRMTDLVIDGFINDGTMKVVARNNADAVLTGTFTRYIRKPFQYDDADQVESYSVIMSFAIALKNPDDDSDIWSARISQEGYYNVADETEEDAQEEAIARLIDDILTRTTKSW